MNQRDDSSFERQMDKVNAGVVFFKNITLETFKHSHNGFPYTIKPGETVPLQRPIGMHLAKHLAMKILRGKVQKTKDGKNDKVTLYTKPQIEELIKKIITKNVDAPVESAPTENEIKKQKGEELKEQFKDDIEKENSKPLDVDRGDLIKELEKRGIKHNKRATNEELYNLILEDEKNQE